LRAPHIPSYFLRVSSADPHRESFDAAERAALAPYFTNLDRPVFALRNLPEVVKGALFARYSRSPKSLRRLFLDEFHEAVASAEAGSEVGVDRADRLYDKVFNEYGDDSVAQLGGAHLACEDASNILTKILEWGRLMAYLEQSTRYIPYTARRGGRWRYLVPGELDHSPLCAEYIATLDDAFAVYARSIDLVETHLCEKYPRAAGDSEGVYRRTLRAKALDAVRGLLPAATQSNVGLFGTGQAFEALLLRMRAHPLGEARDYADAMLVELRKVIPAFLKRVDLDDRGVAWSRYLANTAARVDEIAARVLAGVAPEPRDEVTLVDFDPAGEEKVVAAALYPHAALPDDQLLAVARAMPAADRAVVLAAYVGDRGNRRHRPGRAFERTSYRFDIVTDYGAFRDLQRHRLLTLDWQPLGTAHGYSLPDAVEEAGGAGEWRRIMHRCADLHGALAAAGLPQVASYAVPMAYRVRFYMDMNAREAMHVIELRTAPQGHAAYRRVCQQMHRLIGTVAGHHAIAAAMRYADHSAVDLERLEAERASERRRGAGGE
jgi:thymidylate synthase ThyX